MAGECFMIDGRDNVATLLAACEGGRADVRNGGEKRQVTLREPVELGHKVALADIAEGAPIIKFGVEIGRASVPIRAGDWVHLHNCRSGFDERSASLDLQSGATTDTRYE